MDRLAQTEGLTDIQQEILKTVREYVDEQIIQVATDLEHKDEYPDEIVEGLKEMGIFGLMIPEEYGGLSESLLTYALAAAAGALAILVGATLFLAGRARRNTP